jgi:murein L,D-transpeptidase YcbB/YkuD
MNSRGLKKRLAYLKYASYFGGLWFSDFATGGNNPLFDRFSLESSESLSLRHSQQMGVPEIEENVIYSAITDYFPRRTHSPQAPDARLRSALGHYQTVAEKGGWAIVPVGPLMKKGDRSRRVEILRSRLNSTVEFEYSMAKNSELFDDDLEQAIRNFQKRHGLKADGIVGPRTLAALNVPVEERLRQIRINMERWHQLLRNLGERYILINSANFELKIVEHGKTIASMRAVVGRPDRPTPVLTSEMTHMVLNPYWYIPSRITREDILPKVKTDSEYLFQRNIRVFKLSNDQMLEVDREMIDWSMVTAETFNYRFRQDPGPQNALGRMKFIFPNNFSVYIHDTPAKELFRKAKRNFSSGCIRIEHPVDLAEYLLRSDSNERKLTQEKIQATLDRGARQLIRLPKPIPVHIVYYTAWVDENGNIQFRDDIYGRDIVEGTVLNEGQSI